MTSNHYYPRPLTYNSSRESLPVRETIFNRTNFASYNAANITPREPITTEPYCSLDGQSTILNDAIKRFRGLINGEYHSFEEDLQTVSKPERDEVTDANDLFENFEKCYKARFTAMKDAKPSSIDHLKALPVCRELLPELMLNIYSNSPTLSSRKNQVHNENVRFQKPKEFKPLNATKYFGTKSPHSSQFAEKSSYEETELKKNLMSIRNKEAADQISTVRYRTKPTLTINSKGSEVRPFNSTRPQIERESISTRDTEDLKLKKPGSFMFVQNPAFSMIDSNYKAVQNTLNKIRSTNKKEDKDNNSSFVLNDITNNYDKHVRKGSVKENGELKVLAGEFLMRRKSIGRENTDERKRLMQYQYQNQQQQQQQKSSGRSKDRINIKDIVSSQHSKENYMPASTNSMKRKSVEVPRMYIKNHAKPVNDRLYGANASYRESLDRPVKKSGSFVEPKGYSRDTFDREGSYRGAGGDSTKNYRMLIKYFDLAKRTGRTGGDSSELRSTSTHRW